MLTSFYFYVDNVLACSPTLCPKETSMVFRVFKKLHPEITIEPVNCSENAQFMIDHVNMP